MEKARPKTRLSGQRASLSVCFAIVLAAGISLEAQWIKLQTPGLPRLPDGKPNLSAPAPQTSDGESPVGPSGVAEWPTGEDGWTIALASLPQTGGRPAALARARAARAKGLTAVGLLDSSRYASLHPGYWMVFSGIYASEAEATSDLEDARRFARTATVRRVVP